ncbi:MAG: efflux RND transporter periplasmic adaptor subunit [Haliea sp.]|jgi:RND family efflux transporter MFP subunit|nr:efflux RND transporter periplasmic adaptor subunit [Haliea sp.]
MKKQLFLSVLMLALASGVSLLLFLTRPPTDIEEPAELTVSVDVASVVKQDLRIQVQAQGTVTPLKETAILAEVKGRIVDVADSFNVGGFVSRDEVLLRIDPRDYQTSLLRAQAAVESAESSLAQEKGRAEVALQEWKKLPKGSQRSEEARDLYLRKPQLEQAEAQLLAAQADLNTARDNLERTIIKAPYDALIRAKHSDLGKFVSAGKPLADIFSVESAEVRLPIPQSKLAYLELPGLKGYEQGSPIDLYTDVSGEVKHWTADLHRTEGIFDERSRVLYTVARIEDPYALKDPTREPLRIGTFVNANIEGRELKGLVTLPRYLLRAGNFIWVVDESMHLRNRKVSVLRTGGDHIYVNAGLDEGDLVSLTALDSSFAGSKVTIKSTTPSDKLDQHGRSKVEGAEALNTASTSGEADAAMVAGGR